MLCYADRRGTLSIEYQVSERLGAGPSDVILPPPPHRYYPPDSKIFVVSNIHAFDCPDNGNPSPDKVRMYADHAIETSRLQDRLRQARDMASSIGRSRLASGSYVLDVDLDYFQTTAALDPADPSAFYELLQDAALVTVAREPSYASALRVDPRVDHLASFEKFEAHLIRALGKRDG